jgi:hypothetical protein
VKLSAQRNFDVGSAVDLSAPSIDVIESTHLIQAGYMILVIMCKYDGIQAKYFLPQQLLPKVGTRINNYAPTLPFQKHRRTKSFVSRINRITYLA